MVSLPQLSRTLAKTFCSLVSSSIFVAFPWFFEKGLVIHVPTYPYTSLTTDIFPILPYI